VLYSIVVWPLASGLVTAVASTPRSFWTSYLSGRNILFVDAIRGQWEWRTYQPGWPSIIQLKGSPGQERLLMATPAPNGQFLALLRRDKQDWLVRLSAPGVIQAIAPLPTSFAVQQESRVTGLLEFPDSTIAVVLDPPDNGLWLDAYIWHAGQWRVDHHIIGYSRLNGPVLCGRLTFTQFGYSHDSPLKYGELPLDSIDRAEKMRPFPLLVYIPRQFMRSNEGWALPLPTLDTGLLAVGIAVKTTRTMQEFELLVFDRGASHYTSLMTTIQVLRFPPTLIPCSYATGSSFIVIDRTTVMNVKADGLVRVWSAAKQRVRTFKGNDSGRKNYTWDRYVGR